MLRWLVVLALALLSVPASAQPAPSQPMVPKLRVAIVPFGVGLDEVKVDQLAQDMAIGLETVLDIEALGGLDVRRLLPQGLSQNCVNEPPCPAQLASSLGVHQILFVVFIDVGGAIQLDTTWFEAGSNKTGTRPGLDIPTADQAKQKVTDAAKRLLPDAPIRPGNGGGGPGGRMSPEIPRHFTPASYATAAVAVVGVAVGVTFGISARSRYKDCDNPASPCNQSEHDSIGTRALLADVGYLVAIGCVVATGYLYATSGRESRLVIDSAPTGPMTGATIGARFRF